MLVYIVIFVSVLVMVFGVDEFAPTATNQESLPTPAPIVRHCINRQRVIDEVTDRFFEEVHLLDPNDFSVLDRYTHRPTGSLFTDEEKINMLIYSIIFQAQKPGTGKYLKGRYDVYFENDVACKIQFTELDW